MKICPNCQHTEAGNPKYCRKCASHTAGFLMVDAAACTRCWSFHEVGKPHACRSTRPSNPNVYAEYEAWPTDDSVTYALSGNNTEELETRLYDLTRKQNRTTWENEELARLRAEWKAKKGYDYV